MPDRSSTLSTWDGVSDRDLSALLQKGKGSGRLDLGDVLEVFKDVDLTAPTIVAIRRLLATEGIELDEESDERVELTVVDAADEKPGASDAADEGDDDLLDEVAIKRAERAARMAAGPFAPAGAGGTADPVRMYLKEIGRVPLLTAADEVRLAKRIQRGLSAEERAADLAAGDDCDRVDPGELAMLRRRIRDGERAKGELTQANLRLVVSIAKRYVGRGMLLLDLVQEGNLGLMRAVEKFDHTKGFKFSTYATWWIRQAITRSIAGPVAHDPHPGAHGRVDQSGEAGPAPDDAGARARAERRGARRADRPHRRAHPRDPAHLARSAVARLADGRGGRRQPR